MCFTRGEGYRVTKLENKNKMNNTNNIHLNKIFFANDRNLFIVIQYVSIKIKPEYKGFAVKILGNPLYAVLFE